MYQLPPIQQEMHKDLRKSWIENSRLRIALLGIDIAGTDATLLGSVSLYIISLWFFYSMRRENHLIANLLIDADRSTDQEIKLAVYHGIASYTVFTTIGGDEPIRMLRPPPPVLHSVSNIRFAYILLLFLPAITIAFMIVTDIL
jgi:hypothetical protein